MTVRITVSQEAHAAILRSLMAGRILGVADGQIALQLPKGLARALANLRRPGEDYSATLIRISDGSEVKR